MFKSFVDRLTGKDSKVENSSNVGGHKIKENDDPSEKQAEDAYYEDHIEDHINDTENKSKFNLFKRLKDGLSKTKDGITGRVDNLLKLYKKIDEDLFEELEEILITADIGVQTTMEIVDDLRDKVRMEKISDPAQIKKLLTEKLKGILEELPDSRINIEPSPAIILVVGVNGVGKTTSIAKMAYRFKNEGKKVLLAAGDTFRAAAIDQLKIWSDRVGTDVIRHQEGADPAAVIYDAIHAAKARDIDVLICDTAGRLHNKKNLMNELNKIFRIVDREYSNASKEILLVLDATTGQNAVQQAKIFKEVAQITGLVLTKLDGTAKGGVVVGISRELNIPVKFIGVGEQMEDLQEFDPKTFIEAIFGEDK
ncbi:MAG TPA: signal recognition particle-docking protein FtsY [Oscillospiraceae bacterium]|nr:signal recognition particle-docking protein FtsY [Oscillospiraceae bacterium]